MQDLDWLTMQITAPIEQPEHEQLNQEDDGQGELYVETPGAVKVAVCPTPHGAP